MPTYTVTFPDGATVITHGDDDVGALAGVLLSTGSLGDVIQLCSETAPEVIQGTQPAESGESAILAVVSWWHAKHPEIVVAEANPWTLAKADPTRWHEISRAKSDELLNVLPPITIPGGFAVSEAIRHDGTAAVYLCVVNARGRWWAKESTLAGVGAAVREMRGAA